MTYYGASDLATELPGRSARTRWRSPRTSQKTSTTSGRRRSAGACGRSSRTSLCRREAPTGDTRCRRSRRSSASTSPRSFASGRSRSSSWRRSSKAQLIEFLRTDGESGARTSTPCPRRNWRSSSRSPRPAVPPTKSRFEMFLSAKEHEMHHRAQLMVFERLLGLVPHLTRERQARMAPAGGPVSLPDASAVNILDISLRSVNRGRPPASAILSSNIMSRAENRGSPRPQVCKHGGIMRSSAAMRVTFRLAAIGVAVAGAVVFGQGDVEQGSRRRAPGARRRQEAEAVKTITVDRPER